MGLVGASSADVEKKDNFDLILKEAEARDI